MAGIFVALLVVVLVVLLYLRKKHLEVKRIRNDYLRGLEESGKLTGQLAHEIKNPLSTIKVNLKLIGEDLEQAKSDDLRQETERILNGAFRKIGAIKKEADRLEQIVEGFLRYAGRTDLHLADIDINELLNDMVDFYLPQAHSHSITIRQGLYKKPLICKVDVDMLKQVILNLFINAQQAMSEGGELIIRTSKQMENSVIEISDTGVGIAPDKLDSIFDAYYSSRREGTGLGLLTAKKIIDAHNGTINVESEVGKGTSFMIKLPLKSP